MTSLPTASLALTDARFQELVSLRQRCRTLAKDHLSAIDSFRSDQFPGNSLTSILGAAVSIPTFKRLYDDEDPLAFRVSSTCAAVRSILRHPGASYGRLRPLHLTISLLTVVHNQANASDPAGRLNVLQLAQLADLSEILIQTTYAAQAATHEVESIQSWVQAEQGEIAYETAFHHALSECLNQVARDLKVLADGLENDRHRTVSDANDSLGYSMHRLYSVAVIRNLETPSSLGAVQSASDSPFGSQVDAWLERIGTLNFDSVQLLRELLLCLAYGESRSTVTSGEVLALAQEIVGVVLPNAPIENVDPALAGKERREATLIALTLLTEVRRLIRMRLGNDPQYAKLKIDRNTPAHPYVLYWILAGLQAHDPITGERSGSIYDEFNDLVTQARSAYFEVLARASDPSQIVDAIRLGYHVAIELEFNPNFDRGLARVALERLALAQLPSGSFPKTDRMWLAHSGDAYGLGIELLATLLIATKRDPEYVAILEPCIRRSIDWLSSTKQSASRDAAASGSKGGWVWGEDGAERRDPQAWVTGEAFSFFYLAADHCSKELASLAVDEFHGTHKQRAAYYPPPSNCQLRKIAADFWGEDDNPRVAEVLCVNVVKPLSARHRLFGTYVLANRANRNQLKLSGILFGPPGTAKTTFAHGLADVLGWPLISLGAYHFLKNGSEGVASAAHDVFQRLYELEDCVILFDEMEEFMRSRVPQAVEIDRKKGSSVVTAEELQDLSSVRGGALVRESGRGSESHNDAGAEYVQRLWTTLFLPLLQDLRDRGRVIFLVATNHFHRVDPAIVRPGRFDFRVHVLPPTPQRKLHEILFPELRVQLELGEDEMEGLDRWFREIVTGDHWIIKDADQLSEIDISPDSPPGAKSATYVETEIELPNGVSLLRVFAIGQRFLYFTMNDTRSWARGILRKVDGIVPSTGFTVDQVKSSALEAFREIVPTSFEFDLRNSTLGWSRLSKPEPWEFAELESVR